MDSEDEAFSLDNTEEEEEEEQEDNDMDMDYGCGMVSGSNRLSNDSGTTDDDDFQYEVITADEIVHHMVDSIKEVNTIVQIPTTITRILLNHFRWDREKLMECYYGDDQEKLYSDAHIVPPCNRNSTVSSSSCQNVSASVSSRVLTRSSSQLSMAECKICLSPYSTSAMTSLECGHEFCLSCWALYLTTKIMDEGMGQTISCAALGCDILVDDESIMKLIDDPKVKLKYQQIITNSFVECNRLLHWCPSPDCGHVIKVSYFDVKPVTCICGRTFCFACGENWHDPVQCKWLKKWIKKCDDDSETSNWIAANTHECPKCHAVIEKDGGCNHMVCKRCKFDFCWVCLGPWEPHGSSWYNCNRYDEDEAKKARDAQEQNSGPKNRSRKNQWANRQSKSRAALQRYLFYCNRYMNHMQSLKFEHKLYASIAHKMEEMQQHNMSWIEVQFLNKAVDVLCQCRQTLMYTYVFAFYLRKNNQSLIFEDNQKDLENATEQISEYLERDITSEILVDIKQKVQDKTRYCESRRKVLLDHVHEGYDKDLWEHQDDV